MANPRRVSSSRWAFRLAAALILSGAFTYLPYFLYRHSGFAKYLELREHLTAIERDNRALRAEVEELVRTAQALRDDPHAIEQVARHELGWVRPGEILLDFGAD